MKQPAIDGGHWFAADELVRAISMPPDLATLLRDSSNGYSDGRARRTAHIMLDFFSPKDFMGKRLLEIGPGQYAFALLARELGAEVICVDINEPFLEIGRRLGFTVIEQTYTKLDVRQIGGPVDGVWQKGSFNPCSSDMDETELFEYTERLTGLLHADGWGWVAPNCRAKASICSKPRSSRPVASNFSARGSSATAGR